MSAKPKSGAANTWTLVRETLRDVENGRGRLALSIFLAFLATFCAVLLMGVSGWLLSRAAEHPPVMYLSAAAVLVRAFGIGRGVFRYLERLVSHDLVLRMQEALRIRVYDKLSRSTLLGRRRGDLLTRITLDVEGIMDLIVRVLLPFASSTIVLILSSAILAYFEPRNALVLLGTSVVAGVLVPWWAQRMSHRADEAAIPARGELSDRVREISRYAPDLVSYGATDEALAKLAETDDELRQAEGRGAWTQGIAGGFQMFATGVAIAAALVIGGQAVASGEMLARNLAVLVMVPLSLNEAFADLAKAAQTLTRANTALSRVVALLQAEPVGSGDRVVDETITRTDTAFTDVAVGWPDEPAILSGITERIAAGEKVAVVGPSGLGKTTLAATTMGLIPAKAGEILTPARVSYLAQSPHIFATTLSENVKIGNKDATPEQVADALSRAGLDLDPRRVVGEEGATLSGGEAQRVALARILVEAEKPGLLILDEPTEHLDQETATALIGTLFDELGDVAMLVITHDVDLMARCDRRIDLAQYASEVTAR